MFLDSEPEALYQPLVIPLRGSHTDAKLFHPDDAEKELVPEFFAVGPMAMSIRMRFTQGRRPESGNPIYKCNSPTQGAEAPKRDAIRKDDLYRLFLDSKWTYEQIVKMMSSEPPVED